MKRFMFILVAVMITFGAVIYQRSTGPTYPKKVETEIDGITYPFQLTRSHGGTTDCPLVFLINDQEVTGSVTYRKFPTTDEWTTVEMIRKGDELTVSLPNQPPAGKLEYKVEFRKNEQVYPLHETNATVIRFKGDVPAYILAPHVILMFLAMFLSNLAGVMAFFRYGGYRRLAVWTLVLLGLGGMVLGPWVQWHAFGEAWAGIPFAWDLTDNKTLLAFVFWILAVVMNRKKEQPGYIVVASIVMIIIYSIPHSMYGSQLDPETGKIIQGFISLNLIP
ncbi:MAG: hypothetical protein ACOZDD_02395 [Bacteroidota bacterium]